MIKEWMLHEIIFWLVVHGACIYYLIELILMAHIYIGREKLAGIIRALLYIMVQFVEFTTVNWYR